VETTTTTPSTGTRGEMLDLSAVMKASQAISGEIVFNALLDKLMNILIENAGAQSGAEQGDSAVHIDQRHRRGAGSDRLRDFFGH